MDDLIGAMEDVDLNSLQEDGLGPVSSVPINTKQLEVKRQADSLGDGGGSSSSNNKSFVVVDLKATCWDRDENKDRRLRQEIVEFSSVLVDAATGHTKSTFHEYVIPTENHLLSEYCKNHNGIKQEDVDRNDAMSLDKALDKHQAWIGRLTNGNSAAAVVVTWGNWDCRTMLKQECFRKKLDIPDYFHRWINLKAPFAEKYGNDNSKKYVNEALEATGLEWEGAIKGGESHAHNKARLLSLLIHQGANLAITSWLDDRVVSPAAPAPSPTIPGMGGHAAGHPSSTPGMGAHDLGQTNGSIRNFLDQQYSAMELNILERVVAGSEEPSHLDLSLLQSITENFSEQRKIGFGGCGNVYKGILRNGIVAVKRLFNNRTIKDKMFHREVQSLITVRHKNIVRFLGYCSFTEEHALIFGERTIMAEIRERLLCFEYIRNGNLENYLTDELRGLEWHTRYEIIVGICKGLLYLHKDKDIVHMDLKPANILLDDLMVPKITDFGLSRLDNSSQAVSSTRLMSPGYCAPEYFLEGKSSSKSDIYSFGVMVRELVTGSKKEHDITKVLRKWSHRWNKSSKHTPLGYRQVTRCLELAQRCIQIDPTARPDIIYIMDELNTIDSEGGQFQEIPFLDDMLGIEPLEIHFPFELDLQMSHSIELANDTNGYIAFMTEARSHRFRIEPDKGIVPPGSKCGVIITMQAHVNALPNNHHKEEITLLSTRVDGGIASMDITRDMFIEKEGTVVDEVNVMVVFNKPPSAEEES